MAIKPKCIGCREGLKKFGGILLGPPNAKGFVMKDHLCQKCYARVIKMLKRIKK